VQEFVVATVLPPAWVESGVWVDQRGAPQATVSAVPRFALRRMLASSAGSRPSRAYRNILLPAMTKE